MKKKIRSNGTEGKSSITQYLEKRSIVQVFLSCYASFFYSHMLFIRLLRKIPEFKKKTFYNPILLYEKKEKIILSTLEIFPL